MLHVADAAVKYHQVPPVYIIFFSSFLCCLASTPQMLTKLFVPVFQHLVLLKREASINLFLEMAGIQRAQLVQSKTPLELCSVLHNEPAS